MLLCLSGSGNLRCTVRENLAFARCAVSNMTCVNQYYTQRVHVHLTNVFPIVVRHILIEYELERGAICLHMADDFTILWSPCPDFHSHVGSLSFCSRYIHKIQVIPFEREAVGLQPVGLLVRTQSGPLSSCTSLSQFV